MSEVSDLLESARIAGASSEELANQAAADARRNAMEEAYEAEQEGIEMTGVTEETELLADTAAEAAEAATESVAEAAAEAATEAAVEAAAEAAAGAAAEAAAGAAAAEGAGLAAAMTAETAAALGLAPETFGLSIVAGGAVIAGTAAVVEIADHWDDVEHGAEAVGDWLNPFNNGW